MMTYSQLKSNIPLYSDLACLVLEFLEPCVDYDVSTCTHIQCVVCNRHVGEIRQGGRCTVDVCRFCGFLGVSAQDLKIIKDYIDGKAKKFIVKGTATLDELYNQVGQDSGWLLSEMYGSMSRGESRSCIRNVCRRVAEFRDGTPVELLYNSRDKRVQPVGTAMGCTTVRPREGCGKGCRSTTTICWCFLH